MQQLEKEAFFRGLKTLPFFRSSNVPKPSSSPVGRTGKMVTDPANQLGIESAQDIKWATPEERLQYERQVSDQEGSGSFFDITLPVLNWVTPKSWDLQNKIQEGIFRSKKFLTDIDTRAGSAIAGDDPTSFRGRIFSVPIGKNGQGVKIGEKVNADGSISPIMEGTDIDQRPSVFAPVINTYKLATPFLATAYLANQFFPQPNQEAGVTNNTLPNTAQDYNERMAAWEFQMELDKQASFDKIAQLEEEILEKQAYIDELLDKQKRFTSKEREWKEREQKLASDMSDLKQEYMSKRAEFEEFRLRTVARERSKYAVKLAEEMLEAGLIKQASFQQKIDDLMECTPETFEMQANLVKQARKNEEGLETLSFLSEYRDNDNSLSRPTRGLSKSGKTIGEAARELRN